MVPKNRCFSSTVSTIRETASTCYSSTAAAETDITGHQPGCHVRVYRKEFSTFNIDIGLHLLSEDRAFELRVCWSSISSGVPWAIKATIFQYINPFCYLHRPSSLSVPRSDMIGNIKFFLNAWAGSGEVKFYAANFLRVHRSRFTRQREAWLWLCKQGTNSKWRCCVRVKWPKVSASFQTSQPANKFTAFRFSKLLHLLA